MSFQALGHGITVIDTDFIRPGFDAAYLIVQDGRAAFIDCGVNHSVPRLLEALAAQGLGPEAVDWVIPTHVHLDHAGGAGLLMQQCPNATLLIHPRGARHMIDPTALVAGATAVYGAEEIARTYGQILPVPAARVREAGADETVQLAGRPLRIVDTPGHARHHFCVWDAASRGWFTGDTFGISYPECTGRGGRYLLPTTTPVQFEPEALHASVERLMAEAPVWMYVTHYGALGGSVEAVQALAVQQHAQIDQMVAAARAVQAAHPAPGPVRHQALRTACADIYVRAWQALGGPADPARIAEVLFNDIELNAQGLGVWLDRGTRA